MHPPTLPTAEFLAAELRATRVLLFKLLNEYSFTWHYSMEKVGYECSFCAHLIRNSGDLYKVEQHQPSCPLILAQQLRGSRPYIDGRGPFGRVAITIVQADQERLAHEQ